MKQKRREEEKGRCNEMQGKKGQGKKGQGKKGQIKNIQIKNEQIENEQIKNKQIKNKQIKSERVKSRWIKRMQTKGGQTKSMHVKGSLTVEAAFLVPLLSALVLFLLYLGFYLYNFCVTDQCAYLAAFRASGLPADKEERCALKAGEEWEILREQRLLPFGKSNSSVLERLTDVTVETQGEITFPLQGLVPGSEAQWKYASRRKAVKIRPVIFIREMRRLRKIGRKGGEQYADSFSAGESPQLSDDP